QPLVEDADVLAREVGKIDGCGHPRAAATLADLDLRARDALEHAVHVVIRHDLALEAGRLEDGNGAGQAVGRAVAARREQLAAVTRDGQRRMVRALENEPEEREHARPRAPRAA